MAEFKDGGLLSRALEKVPKQYAAVCETCKTAFVDDMPMYGPLQCPNCGGLAVLRRGVTFEDYPKMTGKS